MAINDALVLCSSLNSSACYPDEEVIYFVLLYYGVCASDAGRQSARSRARLERRWITFADRRMINQGNSNPQLRWQIACRRNEDASPYREELS